MSEAKSSKSASFG